MRKLIFLPLILMLISYYTSAQAKRALIVAIGHYPKKGGWEQINSINDVPLVKNALLKQQFAASDIIVITDSLATRAGIEKAMDELIRNAQRGDIVVIYFSSHGQQIEDDNKDESDGLDECIVPYDAVLSNDKTLYSKYAAGYFRDDVFGEKVTMLRNKLGKQGDLLVGLDACHSGSGTRGATAKARGNKSPMVSDGFDQQKINGRDTAGVFNESKKVSLDNDASSYVVISGARAKELNYECYDDQDNPVGSLSYAFTKTLSSLDGNITYRKLFARIEDVMRENVPNQNPVLEGDGIDRELFGGKYQRQEPYVTINATLSTKEKIILNAGTVSGVYVGSAIGFYPGGTSDPAKSSPIMKGTVIAADNFNATVKPEKEDPDFLRKKAWAFITEMAYGTNKIRLSLDSLPDPVRKQVSEGIKSLQQVDISNTGDLYLGRSTSGNGIALRFMNTGFAFADELDAGKITGITDALKRYARFHYLRNLKINEQGLSAEIELVYLDKDKNPDLEKMRKRTNFGKLEIMEADVVYLKIRNTGSRNFYINIVDIQPDGFINPVLPNKKLKKANNIPDPIFAEDCLVKANDSLFFRNYAITIAPPYGEETFKVFLSSTEIDLENMLTNNGENTSQTRGVLKNIEKIFGNAGMNNVGTRGVEGRINSSENGTIFSLNFNIIPKEK